MESTGPAASRSVPVTVCSGATRYQHRDLVAIEAPLEVRLNGERFAVIMRTPGADRPLALGFLFSEGVIDSRADVVAVDAWPGDSVLGNRVNVIVGERVSRALLEHMDERRHVAMTSACGLCGRVSIESLARDRAPLPVSWSLDAAGVASIPARLRAAQPVFDGTGGLHAAALFIHDGELAVTAEDVGRHNADDKNEVLHLTELPGQQKRALKKIVAAALHAEQAWHLGHSYGQSRTGLEAHKDAIADQFHQHAQPQQPRKQAERRNSKGSEAGNLRISLHISAGHFPHRSGNHEGNGGSGSDRKLT